jgi:succinoglycan biosynthesis protein ExoA
MNTLVDNQIKEASLQLYPGRLEAAVGERCAVIIPCLNEAAHIRRLVDKLVWEAECLNLKIVIVDGGSTDGTREIIADLASGNPRIAVVENEKKLQAAAVNKAVGLLPDTITTLIRIDAHGEYPPDYCETLLREADLTGADSVVVGMVAQGISGFQKAIALAQNSRLGNGGSKHRIGTTGHWIDHGHHALMRVTAFRRVGGYDEAFSHNEDAELDCRLAKAGFRIWMTDQTHMVYYPRSRISVLFKQYLGYGRGRAKNILKHHTKPKLRQSLPLLIAPVVATTALSTLHWSAVVPATLWALVCLGSGIVIAINNRNVHGILAGIPVMSMHLAWSIGFWLQIMQSLRRGRAT